MVYAPGGYNFVDYIKFGLPLQLVCFIFTVAIVFSLEQWWAYALVLAILSPAIVAIYFFIGTDKAHIREANVLDKEQALELGNAAPGEVSASPEKNAVPSPEAAHNIALLPIATSNHSDSTPVNPIAQGNGSGPAHTDHSSANSALIFTGNA
jgi:hypothetical protein